MQNLNTDEMASVSGGHPLVTIGYGVAGAYVYEAIGGKEGIDSYLDKSTASARASYRYWKRRIDRITRSQQREDERRENP
ncbi:hypothetical protein PN836_005275 [Ningiella sp. W23]|uniref:hypothetical protein n=1 Tax=Ningiella sp. W23 TaxID=3023715 RepID=UPI0037581DAF